MSRVIRTKGIWRHLGWPWGQNDIESCFREERGEGRRKAKPELWSGMITIEKELRGSWTW